MLLLLSLSVPFQSLLVPATTLCGTREVVGLLISIVVAVVCGAQANQWYLSHARGKIAVARSQGHEGDALTDNLGKRGGTSVLASLGMLLLFVGMWVVVEFFGSLEFGIL